MGEPLSLLEHALQCAFLARRARASGAEVLAGLLHDIGHLVAAADAPQIAGLGVLEHDEAGKRSDLDVPGLSACAARCLRRRASG
jgi:predicted HD phosphohydrolase